MKRRALLSLWVIVASGAAERAYANDLPPWSDRTDIPLPAWAASVQPKRDGAAIYTEPGRLDLRRGTAAEGVRFPLFAAKRAAGCTGRWLQIAPFAWMCGDVAELSGEGANAPASSGPPRYFFAGKDGAFAYSNPITADESAPDQELAPGWALGVVAERDVEGERWGRTRKGLWIRMRELAAARITKLHGEAITAPLNLAWVLPTKAAIYARPSSGKAVREAARYEVLHVTETRTGKEGGWLRVSPEGESAEAWIRSRDVARAEVAPPPSEVKGAHEKWIDVNLSQQTLVAYEGPQPVFAALVSTGKGAEGTANATHTGVFRIWVKLEASTMDNLDDDDSESHYSIEDVPSVQFFDKAIALHGAFWHDDFGRVHSHGCVNLAPIDAKWLFDWTAPHAPPGFGAVLPVAAEPGTVVRVR